tara:strand:+ start:430 stop:984 length:555 start_codon:yes stop_codon:yes gene_type:complete
MGCVIEVKDKFGNPAYFTSGGTKVVDSVDSLADVEAPLEKYIRYPVGDKRLKNKRYKAVIVGLISSSQGKHYYEFFDEFPDQIEYYGTKQAKRNLKKGITSRTGYMESPDGSYHYENYNLINCDFVLLPEVEESIIAKNDRSGGKVPRSLFQKIVDAINEFFFIIGTLIIAYLIWKMMVSTPRG